MHASEVSGKLFEQLNFRGERQKVISSNIANVNTPEYKTKDLVFSEELKEQNILKLKRTTNNHMHLTSSLFQNHEKNTLKSSYIRGSNFKVGWPTI